ncbi:hypothetical protein CPLU01_11157 [Colletotrichum plurivorum]|uniref:DUF2264 domain-containing protein n=1 Tax=Colletotrichum plurivorum TaxID=2175906 RepID=A0A8H6N8R2_9PEZI|nr:hypothetical protein CPLU01_11157 [Colletotrichum plurivorum]
MPPLSGFSDNSFESRDDVVRATEALLRPLLQYFSPGRARVKIPVATGTHFDETAAQLEGFARPLWAVGALLMSGSPDCDLIQPWLDGFEAGVDPNHPEYWGAVEDYDQRMVETEMISFALLAAPPHVLWEKFSPKTQQNLISWLSRLNTKEIHLANWLWFRVFASLALSRVCGVDNTETESQVEADLNTLDTFYITDGWSSDGRWRSPESDDEEHESYKRTGRANAVPKGRNACFYSGSFAIQFSQLLYVRFAADRDPLRTKRYRQQAREFGACFWRFFDSEGAVVPFGRSLTYRFATAGFFAALAVAGVSDMPEPLSSPGKVKGFLLRHLRWWARNSKNIFYPDGTLNLGWVCPWRRRIKAPNGAGRLFTAEGGFAIHSRRRDDGLALPTGKEQALGDDFELGKTEYVIQDDRSTLVLSDAGASGVAAEVISGLIAATSVSALKPEANTNLMANGGLTNNGITLKQRWLDEPVFRFDGAECDGKEDFIEIHV